MQFEKIVTHNRAFTAARAAKPLPGVVALPFAVVACYDPRLDALLRDSLGIGPTESFLFRVAGALLRPDSNSLRSLANSVYFFGVSEVMIVGHSSCRMAAFSTTDYIAAFRARGVARDAFGTSDLRDWAGAIPSPNAGVLRSLEAMATAPYLPRDLVASGVVLDDTTGALEVVSPPASLAERSRAVGVMDSSGAPMKTASLFEGAPPEDSSPSGSSAPHGGNGSGAKKTPAEATPAAPLAREIEDMKELVRLLESTAGWQDELKRVREEVARQRNPVRKLQVVEEFVRRATVNAREVAGSFERLKRETASGSLGNFDLEQLVSIFLKSGGRPRA